MFRQILPVLLVVFLFSGCGRSEQVSIVIVDEITSPDESVYKKQSAVVLLVKNSQGALEVPTRMNRGKFPLKDKPFDNNYSIPPHSLYPCAYFWIYPKVRVDDLVVLVNTHGLYDSWSLGEISASRFDAEKLRLNISVLPGGAIEQSMLYDLLNVYTKYLTSSNSVHTGFLRGVALRSDPFFYRKAEDHLKFARLRFGLRQSKPSFGLLSDE
jgi:hypothetical protein